ncbi:MAG: Type pantothenate kinase [Bacteroidota bacterium]|jgi:type III pantothenate kinase
MVLVIDVGNTRIKAAVFESNTLQELRVVVAEEVSAQVAEIIQKYTTIKAIVLSSVGNSILDLLQEVAQPIPVFSISQQSKFPFRSAYATPTTLGVDRMVLASGAVLQFPGQNRLVIDAGTCITYEYISAEDVYLGGAISPGIEMRYKALQAYTAKLPLLEKKYPEHPIGNSTAESMHVGVVQGVLHEIEGTIAAYEAQLGKFIIILTGGDAEFLAKRVKNTIFANSNFLLEALNQTYQYQTQND